MARGMLTGITLLALVSPGLFAVESVFGAGTPGARRVLVSLWSGEAGKPEDGVLPSESTLSLFLLPGEGHGFVVVCPGGGYGMLAWDYEGEDLARWFNALGMSAGVLRYRVSPNRHPAPLDDARRALRLVRFHGADWGIDPHRVGIMGFSAGGHLACMAAVHGDAGNPDAEDPVERQASRPDFAVLIYPVVSMSEPWGHAGSRDNLTGGTADPDLLRWLSGEKQVGPDTPPMFLVHSRADTVVPWRNSAELFLALKRHNVPVEMHLFERGEHGYGMALNDPVIGRWPEFLARWLERLGKR
ncbi:MAG TPA: alpha/beta hydrolase [Candidatus Hydrogenedentes bacterium]|nr:alpha/beta hydrolase [Candidatus Hydrogenedentota bacterium]